MMIKSPAIKLLLSTKLHYQLNTVDIAVDWITNKIYWTSINHIMVYDLQQGYQTIVINSTGHQVVVDPNTRYIHVSKLDISYIGLFI